MYLTSVNVESVTKKKTRKKEYRYYSQGCKLIPNQNQVLQIMANPIPFC